MNPQFVPPKHPRASFGHSATHLGLQEHSCGEQYPWSVVVHGGNYLHPRNLLTGQDGPRYNYDPDAADDASNSFYAAHALADKWIANHKGLCVAQQPAPSDVL